MTKKKNGGWGNYGRHIFFFSSRRRHTRYWRDWSSDVCSSDLTSTANTGALPADVSTAMPFCKNRTNYKLQRIEKRKLNTNEQKTQLASTKKKISRKNLSKTGESYVNRKLRSEERRVGKECRSR